MSWTNELYHVYELVAGSEPTLAPVAHDTTKAQIEVTIDEHGNFKNAKIIPKEQADTIIPVTEDSGARSSNNAPHPLNDNLKYLAKCNTEFFKKYMGDLKLWENGKYAHPAVKAIYKYLASSDLMQDLINSGVVKKDKKGEKINNVEQEKAFIRFQVNYDDSDLEKKTWLDISLRDAFQNYNNTKFDSLQLCYATGKALPCTYKHPKKIINGAINAKIISSNDKEGFTYLGRFGKEKEAISVSYDFSQKMHNALKWLIKKQGKNYGSLTLIVWASTEKLLQELPDEVSDVNIEDEWEDDENYDSLPLYREWLSKYVMGYQQKFQNKTKVMIMGLDAATTGRLSISLYDELEGSDFLKNLEYWHFSSAWMRYDKKREGRIVKSFSLYEIIRAAYGTEGKVGKLECDEKLMRDNILRLLPCVMMRRHLPYDIIQALHYKASNPLAYGKNYNHQFVVEVTCGMVRLKMNEEKEDVEFMAYDPNVKDRSYLYGCLLAIADKAEKDTYDDNDRENRITNAKRYWVNFSQRPYQTWKIIEERLQPYLNQHPYKVKVELYIQEVTDKFNPEEFMDNSKLETLYLLGYHHFMSYMYNSGKKE